ncbi:hypothetical protein [Agarilytica rhodophyticola]|uniref:hypothetical protein n=1 Tax=Agarilytica rhodophyticola TaxID=1737490 RepID=UPI000B346A82|nr:hypothetical protein [Agarilytica rhodophyticola]
MNSPEALVVLINLVVIGLAYFIVYPKFCGADINKIAINDLMASAVVLFITGTLYLGSNYEFTMLFFTINWFWFALISYALIELPFMFWYFKKHNVLSSLNE